MAEALDAAVARYEAADLAWKEACDGEGSVARAKYLVLDDAKETLVREAVRFVKERRPLEPPPLSTREIEVVRLLGAGLSTKEAAQKLFISSKTVETHRARVYAKTGVRGAVGLTLFAIRHGLVSIDVGYASSNANGAAR